MKDFVTSFSSPTLHAVNLLLLRKILFLLYSFQNYYSNQTKGTPHMGDQDLQLREGLGETLNLSTKIE